MKPILKDAKPKRYYFSTRDLLLLAALSALGGVASTYINAVGDLLQSMLGFAGTTQWAAGLHVLWLTLAVGLTGKLGAGTLAGLLKGAVELLTGNTHGLLVVLVDLVAGVLVDLGFAPFRRSARHPLGKDSLPAFALAGGLASASNVFVFQLFASLPADVLAYGALILVGGVAFLSGVLFAGLLAWALLNALRRAGVVKEQAPVPLSRSAYWLMGIAAILLTVALGVYLRYALRGPPVVHVGGAVAAAYDYPEQHGDILQVTAEGTLRGVTSRYTGNLLRDIIARAQPEPGAGLVLVQAADGYAFFIGLDEVGLAQEAGNPALLLARQGDGDKATYNLVGALNSKAWVRGVTSLTVIGAATLDVTGALEAAVPFDPRDWQLEMDSASLDVGQGPHKYQGASLGKVLQSMKPQPTAGTVVLHTGAEPVTLDLAAVLGDDDVRLFAIIDPAGMSFAVGRLDGQVIAPRVTRVEVW